MCHMNPHMRLPCLGCPSKGYFGHYSKKAGTALVPDLDLTAVTHVIYINAG